MSDLTPGQRIRQVRTSLGLTQVEFAKAIGITQPSLVRIEKDRAVASRRSAVVTGRSAPTARRPDCRFYNLDSGVSWAARQRPFWRPQTARRTASASA